MNFYFGYNFRYSTNINDKHLSPVLTLTLTVVCLVLNGGGGSELKFHRQCINDWHIFIHELYIFPTKNLVNQQMY